MQYQFRMASEIALNYHIVLTRRCNLNCIYCHGGEETGTETEVSYSTDDLARFLSDDSSPVLLFYGGEPTLRVPLMIDIMDRIPHAVFMLQTNATLLDGIPTEYVKRFHSILVSIDGSRVLTDGYRSQGTYDRVLANVRWLEDVGYRGDVVARMAVSEQTDIRDAVRHLLDLHDPRFMHVHWQLNVFWDAENNWQDFDRWVAQSYNPGISKLADEWVKRMSDGTVEGIVPFMPVMYSLLTGEGSALRCGSGMDTFAVHVDGSIGACPICPDWDFSIVGHISKTRPDDLRNSLLVGEPCPSCEEFTICGGRCLFANKQRLWGDEGFRKVCNTVKHLIGCLKSHVPVVRQLVEDGAISLADLRYPEYNNGCEIIP